ncbi:Acyl transferase domain-containing protein [Actinacidiphila alni]|uniref:Acyl transferase domain-containing protein n=1 Tax=Actinacidiphila alni TaxID=380248 RepID=A0A1I2E980_9ACTN|nr:type I polyketide synthase [Actinacidiphila alni]SFE89512.1 Acyl transferase domain-containing protein [Actinacidiphila alni]
MAGEDRLREYLKKATVDLGDARRRLAEAQAQTHEPIAVVGMSCRFPGAGSVDAYWDLLDQGRSAVLDEVPGGRFDLTPHVENDGVYTTRGAFLEDVAGWDAQFFGSSPQEALRMDPQQRLLMELTWEALEDAGTPPPSLAGSRTAVMVGFSDILQYLRLEQADEGQGVLRDPYGGQGGSASVVAGRLAYHFDLRGPAATLDTACSSSLVAVHQAGTALRRGECDLAVAGGAFLLLHTDMYVNACATSMLAPDGMCKTFDESADGYVLGEGAGVVVLERLSDAVRAGHRVHAVIRGSAVNQDGRSNGLTAPSRGAQVDVIRRALTAARATPDDIAYVEAHGSGTKLGDAIELGALTDVFGRRPEERPLHVGAVKTNIGHTQAAAGMAGLIKAVLALKHRTVPRNLNMTTPSETALAAGALRPAAGPRPLPADETLPQLVGVSSFGWCGTNAHVVLGAADGTGPASAPGAGVTVGGAEKAAGANDSDGGPSPREANALSGAAGSGAAFGAPELLPVSAADQDALGARLTALAGAAGGTGLGDLAYTLQSGRAGLEFRRAVVADDAAGAAAAMADGGPGVRRVKGRPKVAYLLPGTGDHYRGMARELHGTEPVFAAAVEECLGLAAERCGADLREALLGEVEQAPAGGGFMTRPGSGPDPADDPDSHAEIAHLSLFTVEYALARLLADRGVRPDLLIGYSLGEYVAATLAGVFELSDALGLVATRARLIEAAPAGRMLAVAADAERVAAELAACGAPVDVAAANGPTMTVVSGAPEAVETAARHLAEQGVAARQLRSAHPFHSALLAPAREALAAAVAAVPRQAPRVTVVSNVTGAPLTAEQAADPGYWADHLTSPVRFADGLAACAELGVDGYVELGPGQTLGGLLRQNDSGAAVTVLGTLPARWSAGGVCDDRTRLLETCGRLWELGVALDWAALRGDRPGTLVGLPNYPFQRTRYWPRTGTGTASTTAAAGTPGAVRPDDYCYAPSWQQDVTSPAPVAAEPTAPVLVFGEGDGTGSVGSRLADLLAADGAPVTEVVPGAGWRREGRRVVIDPADPEQYRRVVAEAQAGTEGPLRVVHLWSLREPARTPLFADDAELVRAVRLGFDSLLLTVQALAGPAAERGVRLLTVTAGAAQVHGGDCTAPDRALAHGFARIAHAEQPGTAWRGVDLDPASPAGLSAAHLAEEVAHRDWHPADPATTPSLIAWRSARRHLKDWRLVPLPAPPAGTDTTTSIAAGADRTSGTTPPAGTGRTADRTPANFVRADATTGATGPVDATGTVPAGADRTQDGTPGGSAGAFPVRADGAYLVTGGTRGLGLGVARELVRSGARRLALVGRTDLRAAAVAEPDGAAAQSLRDVAELEAAGAEVLLLTADVGEPAQLRAAVRACRERFGTLTGVLHAAGVAAGGMAVRLTPATARKVLAPKVLAMGPLAELVGPGTPAEQRPELIVLYSSAVSVFGGLGEGDYSAANTVLDAYGAALADAAAPATRVLSVAWGPWRHDAWQAEAGGGALAERVREHRAAYGFSEAGGNALLGRLAGAARGSLMAVRMPIAEGLREWAGLTDLDALVAAGTPADTERPRFPRPRLRTEFAAPRTELETVIADSWGRHLGIDGIGVHDPFFDLGGNSLVGMAMVADIEKRLDRRIAPAVLFEHPTVAAFAAALDGGTARPTATTTARDSGLARGERRRRARGAQPSTTRN